MTKQSTEVFLKSKVLKFVPPFKKRSAPKCYPCSWKAITENELVHAIFSKAKTKKTQQQTTPTKSKISQNTMQSVKTYKSKSKLFNSPIQTVKQNQQGQNYTDSQEPGPSHINLAAEDSEPISEDEMPDASLCCVCKLWERL